MSDKEIPSPVRPAGAAVINPGLRPDRLALASWLNAGPVPRDEPFRVLELGCGHGANLLPLAFYHPESQFVGLDPSVAAIAAAQEGMDAIGVGNARVEACGWAEIPTAEELGGEFDYVILFNQLSWLETGARDAALAACGRLLAPEGVAYVDAASPEGWASWPMVRRLLTLGNDEPPGSEKGLAAAREAALALARLVEALPVNNPHYLLFSSQLAGILAAPSVEFERALRRDPHLLTASDLDALAVTHGLRRVCEADVAQVDPGHRERLGLQEELAESGLDGATIEAVADALSARRFRSAILCRSEAPSSLPPKPDAIAGLYCASDLAPSSPDVDLTTSQNVDLVNPAGMRVTSNSPLLNIALMMLAAEYPRGIQVGRLLGQVEALLVSQGLVANVPASARDEVCEQLIRLHRQGAVQVRRWEPRPDSGADQRPHRLALFEAQRGRSLTTPFHTVAGLDSFAGLALSLMAETADPDAAMAALVEQAVSGALPITRHGLPLRDPQSVELVIRKQMTGVITLLQQWGLQENA